MFLIDGQPRGLNAASNWETLQYFVRGAVNSDDFIFIFNIYKNIACIIAYRKLGLSGQANCIDFFMSDSINHRSIGRMPIES